MAIIYHTAWNRSNWICVWKVGDNRRKSYILPFCQVYVLSSLLLLIAIWRWILVSIVDEIDIWLSLQQFCASNYGGNMLPFGNCRIVQLLKETQIKCVLFPLFNFATTNTAMGFKINLLSSPFMPWLMRTMIMVIYQLVLLPLSFFGAERCQKKTFFFSPMSIYSLEGRKFPLGSPAAFYRSDII